MKSRASNVVAACRRRRMSWAFSHRRAGGAFSLLELVVALLILSLLAAVAAPRYANALTRQRLEAAARRVMADLAYAQRKAKHTGTSRTVSFNLAGDYYDLSDESHPDHPNQPYRVQLGQDPYQAGIVLADFGGTAAVTFDGYGLPGSGGSVTIQIGTRQIAVSVDGTTGRVSY